MKQDTVANILFGIATVLPISLGIYMTYISEISNEITIIFSVIAGIYACQIYTIYHLYQVKKRLFSITEEKEGEEDEPKE